MAIYLEYEGVPGEVTEEGHKGWIEIHSFQWGVGRGISTPVGSASKRESSSPSVSEVVLSKATCKASAKLFNEATVGQAKKAVIEFTETGPSQQEVYLRFELTNALISGYSLSSGGDRPSESLSLNFTKVEMKYTPYDDKHKAGSPIPAGYDLVTAKKV